MARQVRIEYSHAMYHTMARGDHGEAIFKDDVDRNFFLKTLSEVVDRTGWIIHAYVLMTNHYHFLISTSILLGRVWFASGRIPSGPILGAAIPPT